MQYQNNRAIKLAQYLGNKTGSMYKAGDLMGSYNGLDPRIQAGLLGAGGGALIGGLGNAIFGDSRDGLLSRLLSGAAGGGVVGGLGGAGAQHFGLDVMGTAAPYVNSLLPTGSKSITPKFPILPPSNSAVPNGNPQFNVGVDSTPTEKDPEFSPFKLPTKKPETKPKKENKDGIRGSKTGPIGKKRLYPAGDFEDGDYGRTPSAE